MNIRIRPSPCHLSDFLSGLRTHFALFRERTSLGLPADEEFDRLCVALQSLTAAQVPSEALTDAELHLLQGVFHALEEYNNGQG